jgi:hypothetical protein
LDHADQDRWIEWWHGISAPRAQHGFTILFAYLDRESGEFTWAVRHEADDFDAAEAAYMASPERVAVLDRERPGIAAERVATVEVVA